MKKLSLTNLKARRESDEGFTLIELVIVIAIIGILTAIAIPSYGAIQNTARVNSVEAAATDAYTVGVAAISNGDSDAEVEAAVEAMSGDDITVELLGISPAGFSDAMLGVKATWADDTSISATKGDYTTSIE